MPRTWRMDLQLMFSELSRALPRGQHLAKLVLPFNTAAVTGDSKDSKHTLYELPKLFNSLHKECKSSEFWCNIQQSKLLRNDANSFFSVPELVGIRLIAQTVKERQHLSSGVQGSKRKITETRTVQGVNTRWLVRHPSLSQIPVQISDWHKVPYSGSKGESELLPYLNGSSLPLQL